MLPPLAKETVELAAPLDTPYTAAELAKHDGSDPSLPTLVAIKGIVFDVSSSEHYKPGSNYNKHLPAKTPLALAKSSLNPEDCISNIDDLSESESNTLHQWLDRFTAKYNIVGKVINQTG
ncbi:progesterone binding protein [Syncephalis fuscata]|nr:progesterone binding protein [Syncephalis fuscata]